MRPLANCRVADQSQSVRDVLVRVSRPGRRTGAIMLIDAPGTLTGLFTDSDLARMLEHSQDTALDRPIEQVMTRWPTTVLTGTLLTQAIAVLAAKKISELPVVDEQGKPMGLDRHHGRGRAVARCRHPTPSTESEDSVRLAQAKPCGSRTIERGDAVHEAGRSLSQH